MNQKQEEKVLETFKWKLIYKDNLEEMFLQAVDCSLYLEDLSHQYDELSDKYDNLADTALKEMKARAVSYTHLTLPTNREV